MYIRKLRPELIVISEWEISFTMVNQYGQSIWSPTPISSVKNVSYAVGINFQTWQNINSQTMQREIRASLSSFLVSELIDALRCFGGWQLTKGNVELRFVLLLCARSKLLSLKSLCLFSFCKVFGSWWGSKECNSNVQPLHFQRIGAKMARKYSLNNS